MSYYPVVASCKGSGPNLGFHLVSAAPAAVETSVLNVKAGQSAPRGPKGRIKGNSIIIYTSYSVHKWLCVYCLDKSAEFQLNFTKTWRLLRNGGKQI